MPQAKPLTSSSSNQTDVSASAEDDDDGDDGDDGGDSDGQ